jgi:hypothetical protein
MGWGERNWRNGDWHPKHPPLILHKEPQSKIPNSTHISGDGGGNGAYNVYYQNVLGG